MVLRGAVGTGPSLPRPNPVDAPPVIGWDGPVPRIHDVEPDTGPVVARGLLGAERPEWAELPLRPVGGTGTDHAMYRIGTELVLRVPRTPGAADSLTREVRLLGDLAAQLSTRVPEVEHVGSPTAGYPHPWAVLRWLPGTDAWAARHRLEDPRGEAVAEDLARTVLELRAVTGLGVPRRAAGQRGGPLAGVVERAHRWLAGDDGRLPDRVDAAAVAQVLAVGPDACVDDVPYVLTHGDLIPGNLVVEDGRLAAVIDWGYVSSADPALDLVPAWAVLGPDARERFRALLRPDDATWARARVNALEQALGGIVYYTPRRHPLADVMARTVDRILAEGRR